MATMLNGTRGERLLMIGEVARRSGFSVKALRFYERRGLLFPRARRASGYRLYAEHDLHRLAFIRQAKALGLTLEAIRELVTENGAGMRSRLLRTLDQRIVQTAGQIAMLTGLRTELERRRRDVARGGRPENDRGHCTCLERRRGR
jgi:DNA-binding transcriptional MerR regulator